MKKKLTRFDSQPSIEELLVDESFLNFYFKKDEADILEWEDWAEDNTQRKELIEKSFAELDKLSLKWSANQVNQRFDDLRDSFVNKEIRDGLQIPYSKPIIRWAAAAIILISIGWWYYQKSDTQSGIYKELVANSSIELIEKENRSEKPLLITLDDGSSILLQKGSRLSYPAAFKHDKREVYLDGEAFFEVAKNPEKPFFVFANELVTKVLGTSFTIKAFKKQKDVQVIVRTGKVSVYRLDEVNKNARIISGESKVLDGVIAVPNQQISFDKKENNFSKTLVEQPEMLSEMPQYNFEFRDESAANIFATIQKAYGIIIIYDEELLKECPVTATLSDEPLYGKLDLVCNAIEAQYQVIDGQIIINSKGCKN
ncbi:anti-FecI sigma factor, FecR [Emticicia oligotrophica DSM 17448]|uniref:Anti-FecI sigma factor, FecR n=1 Tax=Emticicia oligotrophica (strain DSM 17448 / CIP 109782 / MTCC 6937 / GPTSA100-15) TaxID=929562 RepID=A0ABM5MWN0_EMTOG|nr:FecR family protein [Emticicia oligotrophica]AFK01495.1 anti-FecI sigma factor, FecR [Emticicia oligotrophica DSM 17448]